MKNVILLLSLSFLILTTAHSQDLNDYALEIWSAEIYHKDGLDIIELDVFNNGSEYNSPAIKIMYNETAIEIPEEEQEKGEEALILQPQSIRKFELPLKLPNNYTRKKIKLEVIISNKSHSMSQKLKVKINP